jgi:hypothetical protein
MIFSVILFPHDVMLLNLTGESVHLNVYKEKHMCPSHLGNNIVLTYYYHTFDLLITYA